MLARILRILPVLLVAVVVCALLFGAYFVFIDPYESRLWSARLSDYQQKSRMPEELRGARYLLTPENGGYVYRHGGFNQGLPSEGVVLDVASSENALASIVYDEATKLYHAVFYTNRTFDQSLFPFRSISISPDRKRIAYAEAQSEQGDGPWVVHVIQLDSSVNDAIAYGFGTAFLDTDTLLIASEEGFRVRDLPTGTTIGDYSAEFSEDMSFALSNDATMLAWTAGGMAHVASIEKTSPLALRLLRSVPAAVASLAISPDALYVVTRTEEGGSVITRYALSDESEGEAVREFPPNLGISKILIP